jgi:signal peptidase I
VIKLVDETTEELDVMRDVASVTQPPPLDSVRGREVRRTTTSGANGGNQISRARSIMEWIVVAGVAAIFALGVRASVLQVFSIPSESMEHTLEIGDNVAVDKLTHRMFGVDRGDVVVFKKPVVLQDDKIKDLVKRVIAVEGDTVEAVNGKVYVNGVQLIEPYLAEPDSTLQLSKTTIGKDQLFMMGDNRNRSGDSRIFGAIEKSTVVGHARLIVWPLSRLGGL